MAKQVPFFITKAYIFTSCGNSSQPSCKDYFSKNSFSKSLIKSNYFVPITNGQVGYYNNIRIRINLSQGMVPALSFNNPVGVFYIATHNQSYPDFYCGYTTIMSLDCDNSFAKLNIYQTHFLGLTILFK